MKMSDLYSTRNRKPVEVYEYDLLPEKLKIQIIHLWSNFMDQFPTDYRNEAWEILHNRLSEEFGRHSLRQDTLIVSYASYQHKVEDYFEKSATLEECLDIIEAVFRFIVQAADLYGRMYHRGLQHSYTQDMVVADLNKRFLENGVGYNLEGQNIIRLDNELLHREVTVPAFNFLNSKTFSNANDEFKTAHEHYRFKRYDDCMVHCTKTIESTLKIICSENSWSFNAQKDTAQQLFDICLRNNLVPSYLQTQFASLRSMLVSGSTTLRNKLGGHGKGAQQRNIPDHFASYMLYLTAATVRFLISCQKEIKSFN